MKDKNTREVIRGMFAQSYSTIIVIGTSLIISVIAAREVSEEEIGTYFLILAFIELLEIIGNLGMRVPVVKFIADSSSEDEKEHLVNNIVSLQIISIFIVSIIAWFAKPFLLRLIPSKIIGDFYYLIPLLFMIRSSENIFKYIMQGFQMFNRTAIIEVITRIINLALIIVFVVYLKLGVRGIIFSIIFSLVIGEIIRIFSLPVSVKLEFEPKLIKKILKFGFVLQGKDILSYVIHNVDIILIASMLNPISVAFIEIARKIPLGLKRVFISVKTVVFPHITQLIGQGNINDADKFINTFLRLTSAVTMSLGYYAFLFQNEIILFVFGEKYKQSALGFGLLMIVLMISSVSQILDLGYLAAGKPGYVLIVNTTVAVVGILGNLIMIPKYGFIGAVYARLLAELCGVPLSYWAARKSNVKIFVRSFLPQFLLMLFCVIGHYFILNGIIIGRIALALLLPISIYFLSIVKLEDINKFGMILNFPTKENKGKI